MPFDVCDSFVHSKISLIITCQNQVYLNVMSSNDGTDNEVDIYGDLLHLPTHEKELVEVSTEL